ncbi:MAG: hypothetical protein IJI53_10590 [Clostridia bacterium]|nr:hypothetical protein [Clostridia bacterium]
MPCSAAAKSAITFNLKCSVFRYSPLENDIIVFPFSPRNSRFIRNHNHNFRSIRQGYGKRMFCGERRKAVNRPVDDGFPILAINRGELNQALRHIVGEGGIGAGQVGFDIQFFQQSGEQHIRAALEVVGIGFLGDGVGVGKVHSLFWHNSTFFDHRRKLVIYGTFLTK